jgi:hypothetical protein
VSSPWAEASWRGHMAAPCVLQDSHPVISHYARRLDATHDASGRDDVLAAVIYPRAQCDTADASTAPMMAPVWLHKAGSRVPYLARSVHAREDREAHSSRG